VPECIEGHHLNNKLTSINAGVFGGNDIQFIKEYTKKAFEFIDKNISNLEKINIGIFNTVYEQYLFYNLAMEQKKDIFFLTKDINDKFEGLANFSGVSKLTKFIHVVGQYKKHVQTGESVARRLLLDFPEYYFRIDGLLKKLII
jgi:hypothetical protein